MKKPLAHKIIEDHLVEGAMRPGEPIAIRIDQTLTQDATGTLAMLEFEAMGVPRVQTELSAQYVDHNLIQEDYRNADDHIFLRDACEKYGVWFSRPGNGVSHPVHMERFGVPGKTLLGSDSHTCAAGSLGMLAMGAGGLEVAAAMAGEPYHFTMPKIMGVELRGELPDWVGAKDVILEMLRRHGVDGGLGKIVEYHGPGLKTLSAMDRHVIANMGAELGAATTVFPSDGIVRAFLEQQERGGDWAELSADEGCEYVERDVIDLSELEPLVALPNSPGNVVPVREAAGRRIYQCYIGSSANPGMRDFAVPAMMVEGKQVDGRVSFDINPASRQILENLIEQKYLGKLIRAGARLHQAGCNGCIGMGQAPATHEISLRTVPRNFPGRSGTKDDLVYLCGPETAAASALKGEIADPRTLDMVYPKHVEPERIKINRDMLQAPAEKPEVVEIQRGPNIMPLPEFGGLPDTLEGPVLIKTGDDISTDDILPAGARVLPYRSNIAKISEFLFEYVDSDFHRRAVARNRECSFIAGGSNYGQGSSREHAALAPRYIGVRAVIAKGFARIHRRNLVNFGILPLLFASARDWDSIGRGDELRIPDCGKGLETGTFEIVNPARGIRFEARHDLDGREARTVREGGFIRMRGRTRGRRAAE